MLFKKTNKYCLCSMTKRMWRFHPDDQTRLWFFLRLLSLQRWRCGIIQEVSACCNVTKHLSTQHVYNNKVYKVGVEALGAK